MSPKAIGVVLVSAAAAITVGCAGSSKTTTSSSATTSSAAVTAPTAAVTTTTGRQSSTTAVAPAGALSGAWSGQYSGSNSGTFKLNWQQSRSDLTGTINISEVGGELPITGKVEGGGIRFGTVGGEAISYTGTVSGNSMSGTWQDAAGHGSWNATKGS